MVFINVPRPTQHLFSPLTFSSRIIALENTDAHIDILSYGEYSGISGRNTGWTLWSERLRFRYSWKELRKTYAICSEMWRWNISLPGSVVDINYETDAIEHLELIKITWNRRYNVINQMVTIINPFNSPILYITVLFVFISVSRFDGRSLLF